MSVDPDLHPFIAPTPLPGPAPGPTIDAQQLQQYLNAMQAEFSNQLRSVNERLANITHEAAASSASSAFPGPGPHQAGLDAASSLSSHPLSHSSFARPTAMIERPATEILGKLLSRPSQFHGEHGNRVYDWLSELDIIYDNIGNATDHQKITFARQCLRDEALRWWIAREQDVLMSRQRVLFAQQNTAWTSSGVVGSDAAREIHQTKEVSTWLEFKQVFVDYFCPRGASEAARNQLHALRQNQFRDLAGYCDRFETVARRIATMPGHDITDELIATFKNGLTDGRIRLHLTTGHPSSLFEATRQAMQAESDLRVSNYGTRDPNRSFPLTNRRPNYHGHHRDRGYPVGQQGHHSYQRSAHWHSANPRGYTSTPSSASRDASTPMDLSNIVHAGESSSPDVDRQVSCDIRGESEPASSRTVSAESDEDDDLLTQRMGSEDASDDEVNFVTRERRPSDAPPRWQQQAGMRERSRFGPRPKQQFLRKNNCWNCGKPGHFLVDCPYQKSSASAAAATSDVITSSSRLFPKKS